MTTKTKIVCAVFAVGAIGSIIEQSIKASRPAKDNSAAVANANELIAAGVFSKSAPGQVWTGPLWSSMSFDDKQGACAVAYDAFGASGITTGLLVKDNRTGKEVARYVGHHSGLTIH